MAEIENPQTAVGDIPAKVREAASLLTYCRRMLKEARKVSERYLRSSSAGLMRPESRPERRGVTEY